VKGVMQDKGKRAECPCTYLGYLLKENVVIVSVTRIFSHQLIFRFFVFVFSVCLAFVTRVTLGEVIFLLVFLPVFYLMFFAFQSRGHVLFRSFQLILEPFLIEIFVLSKKQ